MDPATLSEKKGSVAQSRAAQSYLSNRLSRQRGGGRSKPGAADSDGADRVSLASIKSGSRKLNSQGGKRDMLSTRKSTHDMNDVGMTIGGDADPDFDSISKSAAKA